MMIERNTLKLACKTESTPVLLWPGKQMSVQVTIPRMRLVEATRQQDAAGKTHLLLHGDNLDTLAWLLANGYAEQIKLIYLDPPFDSDGDYISAVRLRGPQSRVIENRIQYRDRWQAGEYLQFMAERLLLLRELLHPDGTLWLHCDHRASARLQLLLEEVFGAESYLNTIIWRSQVARGAKVHARYFPRSAHSIHIFARSPQGTPVWHRPHRQIVLTRTEAAAQYKEDTHGFFRTSHPGTYSFEKLVELHTEGRIYAPYNGTIIVDKENRQIYASNGGNIGVKYYIDRQGRDRFVVTRAVDNLWDDIPGLGTIPSEDVNYPTQKTEGLLRRIIETATDPGDLILDAFVGSGTSVAVSQKLGRPWIGCDNNWGAIRTTAGRLARLDKEGKGGSLAIWQFEPACSPPIDAQVRIHVECVQNGALEVKVHAYHSPALVDMIAAAGEALSNEWRPLIQSIAIDPAYDGTVFRPVLVDAPEGREAWVAGEYTLPGVVSAGPVAVQIVDILGVETLITVKSDEKGR
jgi:DNA modification methylase